jgi:hypothetical protein
MRRIALILQVSVWNRPLGFERGSAFAWQLRFIPASDTANGGNLISVQRILPGNLRGQRIAKFGCD